ncbi:MAG TPA: carboxypeptidase-like regulatory domain-containing protein [Kofleriaceae bacterium]|nr:carboxypeptidase-like regulatory domain-containing protein [Kofleriaceae bacterium]
MSRRVLGRALPSRATLALAAALVVALGGLTVWLVVRRSHAGAVKVAPLRRPPAPKAATDKVTIKGAVYDQDGAVVPAMTVVLLGKTGEATTTSGADGRFTFTVPRGIYRPFVRDQAMITTGLQERQRLDGGPRVELIGALDEALLPTLDASTDLDHLELAVTRAAVITGKLTDVDGQPVGGAVVRARQQPSLDATLRPVLGSDTAISDPLGNFRVLVPAGEYFIEARSSKLAASLPMSGPVSVGAGQHEDVSVEMAPGCVVRGKVVMPDGKTPASDGAVELDSSGTSFSPASRVNVDGTFDLAIASGGSIRVRAWPWRSAPSEPKVFECYQGSRFENVVLKLLDWPVELGGTLVDAHGAPVPFAFVDMRGLDGGLTGQQERTDAAGNFRIYDVLAGRYKLTATAAGRGIVTTTVVAPKTDVQLQLAGTGRIAGTTTDLIDGSIEVSFLQCGNDADPIELAPEPRIVPVRGGRFVVDGAPACGLRFVARWRNRTVEEQLIVEPEGTAHVTLELGTPHDKTVQGIVRDSHGAPAADVRVTALLQSQESATARTDREGRYTLKTRSGAQIIAGNGAKVGHGTVGRANVPSEVVDVVLDSDGDQ